ncbi:hypothetical protein FQN53_007097 [Emmonsiellopsis sp. PD_33]|nr:hypothetical protein FQN53_007097 [Emmonsiellopsis sp. PD_33]
MTDTPPSRSSSPKASSFALPPLTITAVQYVDSRQAAVDPSYARSFSTTPSFVAYSLSFIPEIIGPTPSLTLVSSRASAPTPDQFAHEAGVYIRSTNAIYFTSNYQTSDPQIDLYSIDAATWQITNLTHTAGFDTVTQPNGACNYNDKVLYCAQGEIDSSATNPSRASALVLVDPLTNTSQTLLNNFYGREFSSINDVVIHHPSGDIWFTDPTYGYEQAFRPTPDLPKQVYRFRPATGQCWAVADGFDMCNGLCFSPDYGRLYVTDTGAVQSHGDVGDGHNFSFRGTGPASVYVYDVVGGGEGYGAGGGGGREEWEGDKGVRLVNRRLFAFCHNGVPDGIKCDEKGYVYAGCGDGVHVWDREGTLVGKIVVGGTVANFCFVRGGIWMFAEENLWFCKLKAKGALVDRECGPEEKGEGEGKEEGDKTVR